MWGIYVQEATPVTALTAVSVTDSCSSLTCMCVCVGWCVCERDFGNWLSWPSTSPRMGWMPCLILCSGQAYFLCLSVLSFVLSTYACFTDEYMKTQCTESECSVMISFESLKTKQQYWSIAFDCVHNSLVEYVRHTWTSWFTPFSFDIPREPSGADTNSPWLWRNS